MTILKTLWVLAAACLFIYSFLIVIIALRERLQGHTLPLLKLRKLTRNFPITLIGFLLAVFLYLPKPQEAISRFENIDTVFVAAGGMIGTIIALIISLSILAVQRAAETFTPLISRLYREDRRTHLLFIILVILCILSFVFSINGVLWGLTQSGLFPIQVLFVALTFDLSRMHYRRISQLMDTNEAINLLSKELITHITRIQKSVSRAAKGYWAESLTHEQKANVPVEKVETLIYQSNPKHLELLAIGLEEMAEIASRVISKGEYYAAEKAISSMTDTAVRYLNSRKKNFALYPEPSMPLSGLITGDIDSILSRIYEHLNEINRIAVEHKTQSVSINVVESLGIIGIQLATLGGQSPRLTWKPIGYMGYCITAAQESKLHDVPMRASSVLLRFGLSIPDDCSDIHVYIPVFERWRDLVRNALAARNPVVADSALKEMMALIHRIHGKSHFLLEHLLPIVLGDLYRLVPLCLPNEQPMGVPFAPYAMVNTSSLGYLIESASKRIEKAEDDWTNPYSDFIKLNKTLSGHFRNIADNYDIGSSRLVWEILQTIEHISEVHLEVLEEQHTDQHSWKDELVNQIRWYIAFFWAAFKKSKVINRSYAYEACKVVGRVGILFYEAGFPEVVTSSVGAIESVSASFSQKGDIKSQYQVAELLMFIWQIRLLAEAREDASMIQQIDKELGESDIFKGENKQHYEQAFTESKYRLKRELIQVGLSPMGDDPMDILKTLLMNNYPAMFRKIVRELYPSAE
jgi:hypothetical protein